MPKSKYLQNKHSGGSINQRGNDYEVCFACLKIMQLIAKFRSHLGAIVVSSQGNGYVDDFWVKNLVPRNEEESFYQLKTSSTLSWGKSNKQGTISFDFHRQKSNLKVKKIRFRLGLIVSNRQIAWRMKSRLPKSLSAVCDIYHFPWGTSIDNQVLYCKAFRKALQDLCALPGTDKLQALANLFAGAWVSSGRQNVSLEVLFNKINAMGGIGFLKSPIPLALSPKVKAILDAIPAFRYQIHHGYLVYFHGSKDEGAVPYMMNSPEFRNIENEIIAKHPITFTDLEPIII